jgi:hypothetical protein
LGYNLYSCRQVKIMRLYQVTVLKSPRDHALSTSSKSEATA